MPVAYEKIAARNVERLAALSDGLFAIAMTLLIIDLHTPAAEAISSEKELFQSLLHLMPQIVMYFIGFMTLGIFWIAQQSQIDAFTRVDRDLTWIHLGFLAAVALRLWSRNGSSGSARSCACDKVRAGACCHPSRLAQVGEHLRMRTESGAAPA